MADKESRKERVEQLQKVFEEGVLSLANDASWRRMMDFLAKFRRYSFNNTILIYMQKPDATMLAGYKQWMSRGRKVKRGEKSIKIFGHSIGKRKDENGNVMLNDDGTEATYEYFPILSVFDVSQTEPIPGKEDLYAKSQEMFKTNVEGSDPEGIYEKLQVWLQVNGYTFSEEKYLGGAQGATSQQRKQVRVLSSLSPATKAATLIHECAHVLLHKDADDYREHRGLRETEAESVGYIVGKMHGLDTSEISIPYVTSWSNGDKDTLMESTSNVYKAAMALDKVLTGEALEAK